MLALRKSESEWVKSVQKWKFIITLLLFNEMESLKSDCDHSHGAGEFIFSNCYSHPTM